MTVAELFETMEYGPAPESDEARARVDREARRRVRALHRRRIRGARGRAAVRRHRTPRRGKPLAHDHAGHGERCRRRGGGGARGVPAWKALAPHARAQHLYALARGVQKHSRLLAVLESMDNGKSIRETRDIDIPLVARHFYHHAGWAQLMRQRVRRLRGRSASIGQIIPWNFPLLMLAWKIAPALAAGNTIVLKPAEFTPLTALCFAEIAARSGIAARRDQHRHRRRRDRRGASWTTPTSTRSRSPDRPKSGASFARRPRARARSSASSWAERVRSSCYEDADLDSVVEGVVDAIWFNQGQVCCAGSRLLVQEGVADRLVDKLRARMEKLRVGSPLDKAVDMGAIVAPVQLERIRGLVDAGRRRRRRRCGSRRGRARPKAASIRRRCSPTCSRRRRSRRWRSSGRCWSR